MAGEEGAVEKTCHFGLLFQRVLLAFCMAFGAIKPFPTLEEG